MAKIKYYLKNNGSTGSIYVRISLGRYSTKENNSKSYKPLRLPLGIKGIMPAQWDVPSGRVVTRTNKEKDQERHDGAVYINGMLQRTEARLCELCIKAETENRTNEEIKDLFYSDDMLSKILGREAKRIKPAALFDDGGVFLFIEKEIIEKSIVSEVTKKAYRYTLKHMREFEKARRRLTTWKTMDLDYYKEFITYLHGKGLRVNTVGNQIKHLKKFLGDADFKNIPVCQDFKARGRFVKPKEETQAVYITDEELSRIEALDYSNNPRLDRVRDLFLIGCNTGLRVSDLMYLKTDHVKDDRIKVKTQKTGIEVVIPIFPQLKRVLEKNNGEIPKAITAQKYNHYLKEVAKDAGLTEIVITDDRKGALSAPTKTPKFELITSHTARRTFATNMYRKGLPASQIMLITGHSTEGSFKKYIKVSKDENADDIIKQMEKPKLKKAE